MKAIALAIALLLTLTSVHADLSFNSFNGDFSSLTAPNGAIALSDLITVANYYGCKTWVKNQCTECSQGYHFSAKGVCCEVPTLCSQFNLAQGVCLACYQGYSISNGTCKLAAIDTGCATWKDTTCAQCSAGWFLNNGTCSPVSDQCYTWDSHTGACLSCYNGYVLNNGVCSVNPNPATGAKDPLCATWLAGSCSACASRAYFNDFGVCTAVSDQCQTWDPKYGVCLSCYGGYTLTNGVCSQSPIQTPSDLGCALWNTNSNVCLQCSQRYYFNGNKCAPVNDQCNTFDSSTGRCTTCYNGYDLQLDGTCQLSTKNTAPSDAGCGTWDWKNQKCLECSNNWVFNGSGVCVPVSDQCNTFDRLGNCFSCYLGYNLVAGKCVLAPIQNPTDAGCGTWDWKNQKCLQCSNNWVFNNNGVCVPVSDQCNTFDISGNCVSCYLGYNLVSGKCVLAPIQKPTDAGCGTWDWKNKKCLQCSNNWVFNTQGVCVPVSDQCNTFDLSGNCVTCYLGYNLQNGKCVLAPIQNPTDAGCATWDWKNQKCLQCSNNWVFNSKGVCVTVSDQCKTFDLNGNCVSCYTGYNLDTGKCVVAPVQAVSDVGCGLWDWNNQKCLQCSNNWVFNTQGACVPVSDQCKTFDLTGNCVSCYDGYNLVNGSCILAPIQAPSDLGCGTWDWKNQKCLQCSNNWVFNDKGACIPVSDQCNTYDITGKCVTCYKGYNLVAGKCVLAPIQNVSDVGCGVWDWDNQVCKQCSNRWVFNSNKKCVPVSDNCQIWDNTGACTSCYSGYVLNGGSCSQGNSLCQASNSNGACTSCYSGYILDNGNCVPISKLANLALYYSLCCPERLAALSSTVGNNATSHVPYHA